MNGLIYIGCAVVLCLGSLALLYAITGNIPFMAVVTNAVAYGVWAVIGIVLEPPERP